ncbi:hypothetical protein D5086_032995, partial [Populus alba]
LMKAELNSASTSAKMVDDGDVKGDTKCLALVKYTAIPPENQIKCEQLKKTESKTIYFCHKHKLTRANCARGIKEKCKVCQLRISSATYCCINCNFFLHESCLETPQEIQHQYHLQHPLLGRDFDGNPKNCRACNLQIWDIAYYCDICDFALHFTCATYLTSTLKHEFHREHTLFSFVASDLGDQGFIQSLEPQPSKGNFCCETCGNDCSGSFYRCVECNINRHLECIPLPFKVQQEDHHLDPITHGKCSRR